MDQTSCISKTATNIVNSIQALTNPDKSIQSQANDYLYEFSNSPGLDLPVISQLIIQPNIEVRQYTTSILYAKLKNNYRDINPTDKKEFDNFIQKAYENNSSYRNVLKGLSKCLAFSIVVHMEENDFSFIENYINGQFGINHMFFDILNQICEVIKDETYPKKQKRIVSYKIKDYSIKLIQLVSQFLTSGNDFELSLELIDSLSSLKIDFFENVNFIKEFLLFITKVATKNNEMLTYKSLELLENLISNCSQAKILEYSNLSSFLEDYANELNMLNENVYDVNNKKLNILFSIRELLDYLPMIKRFNAKNYYILSSLTFECFPQYLICDNVFTSNLMNIIENNFEEFNPKNIDDYLMLEWFSYFVGVLQSELGNTPAEILNYWKNLSVNFTNILIDKTILKNDKELKLWKLFNFTNTEDSENNDLEDFKEINSQLSALYSALIKMIVVIDKKLLPSIVEEIIKQKLAVKQGETVECYTLKIESITNWIKSTLVYLYNDFDTTKIIFEFIKYILQMEIKSNELITLSFAHLLYSMTEEGKNKFYDQMLFEYLMILLDKIGYSIATGMIVVGLNNLISHNSDLKPGKENIKQFINFFMPITDQAFVSVNNEKSFKWSVEIFNNGFDFIILCLKRFESQSESIEEESSMFFDNIEKLTKKFVNSTNINKYQNFIYIEILSIVVETMDMFLEQGNDSLIRKDLLNFFTPHINTILNYIDTLLEDPLLRKKVFHLLKKIMTYCTIDEINYVDNIMSLVSTSLSNRIKNYPEIINLFNHMLTMNAELPQLMSYIINDIDAIETKLTNLNIINSSGNVILTKDELFEIEYIRFESVICQYFAEITKFNDKINEKLTLYRQMLNNSRSFELKKEVLKL